MGHGDSTRQLAVPVRLAGLSIPPSRRSVRLENVIFYIAGDNAGLNRKVLGGQSA
jgi:hypothetical protein